MNWEQFTQKWGSPPDTVALQVPDELDGFLEMFKASSPMVTVEIGTMHGATVWQWAKHSPANAKVIAVDLDVGLLAPSLSEFGDKIVRIQGGSQWPETVNKVASVLDSLNQPIQCLFVDADHTGDNPIRDFNAYAPHLKRGALVGFHDVDCADLPDVGKCWDTLKERFPNNHTFSIGKPDSMGIGCFWYQ